MIKKSIFNYLLCTVLMLMCNSLSAQSTENTGVKANQSARNRVLPFGADWARQKGIALPSPYGVSTFFTYMGRNIEITDVTVEFGDREPESISEFSTFAAKNQTYVSAVKLDAWVLPFLNVYALVGYANTTAKLNADITIERSILPLPPVEMKIQTATKVKGPYTGFGTMMVAGYKSWFMMADANYGISWPDLLNNSINFTLLSLRSGLSGKIGEKKPIMAWLGAAYMDSKSTLEIKAPSDVLGEVTIRVEQHPVNPWTYQCGFSVGLGKRIEFMTELGSNFDDASILVLNAAYRF